MTGPEGTDVEAPVPAGSSMLDLRVRFERFPATIKGAFVLQGADGDPHSVQFSGASVARVPAGSVRAIPLEVEMVDAAPTRNLFVPFEAPISELEPGWYAIAVRVRIDSGKAVEYRSRLFSMAWPRSEVRRGMVGLGEQVEGGGRAFRVERVEMGSDHSLVAWRETGMGDEQEPGIPPGVVLLADGLPLETLPATAVPGRDRGQPREQRALFYPVPRGCASLAVALQVPPGAESLTVAVPLP